MADGFAVGDHYSHVGEFGRGRGVDGVDIEFAGAGADVEGVPVEVEAADELDVGGALDLVGVEREVGLVVEAHILHFYFVVHL